MTIKARSRREKVGSGLGLLLGIIGFNLLVPFFFAKQVGFDGNQMLWAAVTALLCAELGARVGKWLDRREQTSAGKSGTPTFFDSGVALYLA